MLKPSIPRRLQIFLRRQLVLYKRKNYSHIWPIDPNAGKTLKGWKGWPYGEKFSLVLTHDVETQKGLKRSYKLMDLEKELGFKSIFNFVPERYNVSAHLRRFLRNNGFEIGVHGLLHDGKLFKSMKIFEKRSIKINKYIKD